MNTGKGKVSKVGNYSGVRHRRESQTLVTVVLTEKSDTDDPGVTECRLETDSGWNMLVTTSTQRFGYGFTFTSKKKKI